MSEKTKVIAGVLHKKITCISCKEQVWAGMSSMEKFFQCDSCCSMYLKTTDTTLGTDARPSIPKSEYKFNG